MRISTKGRYGLRILLDVALHQAQGPVTLRDIAQRQEISQKYLWQVINPLKAAGFLHATRGALGGYVLARSASAISVLDVVNTLEGSGPIVACCGTPESCERSAACIAREAWNEIEGKLSDAMRSITLQILVQRHKDLQDKGGGSYAI